MTRNLRLTPNLSPGDPAPRSLVPALLALAAALVAGVVVLATQLAGSGAHHAESLPSFLGAALGAQDSDASLVRKPAPGTTVEISERTHGVRTGEGSVSISSGHGGTDSWTRFGKGASRPTPFGAETIVVDSKRTEQFLTVDRRLGRKTWRWNLETLDLRPRVGDDGAVGFLTRTGRLAGVTIAPPAILDAAGRDVSPKGLRWSLPKRGSRYTLELELDDAKLPLPYVIDPAFAYQTTQASNNGTGTSTNLTVNVPAAVQNSDLLIAHVAVRGTATITEPAGWTMINETANTQVRIGLYYRVASSEPASYAFSFSAAQSAVGSITAWDGLLTSTPVDVIAGAAGTGNSATASAPSITTTQANSIVVAAYAAGINTAFGAVAGMTERYDVQSGHATPASRASESLHDMTQVTAGATGAKTSAITAARWVGKQAAFRVDNVNPTGAVTAPAASANVRGAAVTVSSNSADAHSGVANAQFQRSPAGAGTWTNIGAADTTSPYSVTWDTTAVADGLYDLRVITTDDANNTFTSALVTNVRVDNTNPTGSVTAPAASANVTGAAVSVTSNSADAGGSGVASAQFQRSPAGAGTWTNIGAADTTSPYSATWDTTAVTDGLYDLRVITTDNAGNAFTSALVTNVRVDNTDPSGSVTAPIAGTSVTDAAVTVSSNSADTGSGVANAQFQRSPAGAGTWTNIGAADTSSPYSATWDTTAVSDGLYDLRVITTDNVGRVFNSVVTANVRVDNTNPTGAVTAPAASADVRGAAVTVSSDSADAGSGVANAQFQRSPAGAGTWTNIGAADTSAPYSVAWDTTALSDGLYDLRVITTDNVGKVFTSAVTANVRVDNTNPTGAVTAPAASANVRGAAVTVSSDSADAGGSGVANAQFQRSPAGAGTWTNIGAADTTAPYSVAWDSTAVGDGLYDLRVVTTDNAGNTFTSALVTNVRVDNTNPTGAVTAPSAGANVTGSSVTVSSDSADTGGSGVSSAQFQRSPAGAGTWTNIGAADTTSPYSASWDTTAVGDGLYDLRVVTTDNAGNTFNSATIANVRVDNTNPTGAVTVPAGSADVRGSAVAVSSDSADAGSGVANAQFQRSPAGAGTWTNIGAADTSSPYSASWDTTALSDGLYDLRVITTDNVGKVFTSTATANVRVDNTNPTGAVTGPAAGSNVRGAAVAVSSDSADAGSGVSSAQFQRSPAGAGTWTNIGAADTSSPYSASWDTTAVGDGLYDLRVVTTDNAGNTFNSATIANVRVDNTNPTGAVTAPTAGANVRGAAVTVSSDSADAGGSGVSSAQFQRSPAGAGTWTDIGAADTSSPYSASWDTTAVGDGLYDLRVVTTDDAGNTFNSATIANVRVDNTNPANAISLTADSPAGSSYKTGTTVYYRGSGGGSGGSVKLRNAVSDGGSGPASSATAALGGTSTGWTHAPSTVSTPAGGPYDSAAFDWAEGTTSSPTVDVTGADAAGNTVVTTLMFTNDSTAPTVTAPDVTAGFATALSVPVTLNGGSDSGAGVASGSSVVQRDEAPLDNGDGTCDAFPGSWSNVTLTGGADTGVSSGKCYRYRELLSDRVGNQGVSSPSGTVKVDTSAPAAPPLSFGSFTNASATGTTVYIRPGVAGGLNVTASPVDAQSGIVSAAFPALGAGWSGGGVDASSPYQGVYTFSAAASAPSGNQDVTATNGAGTVSAASPFTVVEDSAAPVTNIECNAGSCTPWFTSTPVSVTLAGADGGAGIAEIRYTLDGSDPDGTSPLYSGALSIAATTTVKYRAYDRVGNVEAVRTRIVQVDTTAPSAPTLSFAGFTNASATGSTVYVRTGTAGGFTVAGPSVDGESGIASVTFPALGAGWTGGGADAGAPYEGVYTFTAAAAAPSGNQNVVASNGAGTASGASPFTVVADTTAPASSALCDGGSCAPWFTTSPVSVALSASDGGSGVAAIRYTLDGSDPSPLSALYSTPLSIAATTTVKFRAYDNVGNEEAVASVLVRVDTTIPSAPALSFGSFTNASATGTAAFMRPGVAGGFTITGTSDDPESSVASLTFPALGAGWTGGGVDSSSPYEGAYTFGAATSPPGGNQNVTAQNGTGSSSNPTPFTVTSDGTAPTSSALCDGGSCAPWFTTSPVSVALSASDGGSGVAAIRYTLDGSDPSPLSALYSTPLSIAATTTVKFRAYDNVGNEEAVASVLVRVDTTQPSVPSVSLSETDPDSHVFGTTLYYNPSGSNSGSFTVDATSADAESAIDRISFPAVAGLTGGGDDLSSPYSAGYDWTSSTSASGAQTVTARNGAGLTRTADFTLTPDTAAPSGHSVSVAGGGWATTASVSLVPDDGTDSGSGVDTASRVFERDEAPLVAGACDPFGGSWTTVSNPDNSVQSGKCYRYRLKVSDRVGNQSAPSAPSATVRVDTSAPAAPTLTFSAFSAASETGSTVYYRPSAAAGSFTVTASATDAQSDVASYAFPAAAGGWSASGSGATRTYSHTGSPTDPADPNDVTATNGAGLTSSAAPFTVSPDAAAPTGMSASVTGGFVTSLSVPVTLDNGTDAASGVDPATRVVERDEASLDNGDGSCDAFPGSWSTVTLSGGADTSVTSGKCYRYRLRIFDRVGNEGVSAASATVKVDTSAPAAPTLGFSALTNASASGSTVWFRTGATGGFTLTPTASDAESGIASTSHPNLGSGWTRTGNDYTFTAAAADPVEPNNVTVTNGAALTSPATGFTVSPDSTAPAGGSVTYPNGYDADGTVTITSDNGTDGESGVDAASALLERQTAPLTADACGSYGSWGTVTSPDTVSSGNCARYRLRVSDRVGNEATYTSANVVKVDTSAPAAPSLGFSALTNASASGSTVWFRPGAAGGFTLTPTASDAESGISSTSHPSLGSGWSRTGNDYSFTAAAADPVEPNNVTVTNGAGLMSPAASFTVSPDSAAPTGGSVTYSGGYDADGTITITTDNGSDGDSGVASGTAVLERQTATLAADACGSFGGWSTVTSPDTVATASCARYRLRVSDRVGNEATFTSATTVKVDLSAPSAPTLTPSEGSAWSHASGTTVYLNAQGANAGLFTVAAASADSESGLAKVNFPALAGAAGGGDDTSAPFSATYGWDASTTASGAQTVIAHNVAGLTSSSQFDVVLDTAAPTGGSVTYPNGYDADGTVTVTTDNGSDAASGVAAGTAVLERQIATLAGGSCGSFGGWSTVTSPDSVSSGNCARYRLRVSDRVGNEATFTSADVVRVDTDPATVTLDDPGANLRATVTLTATASDGGSGVATVEFQRSAAGAGSWTTIATDSSAPYSASFDTTAVADGLVDLRAIATDAAGNPTTSATVTNRRVDNTAPAATMNDPGANVRGTVTLTATSSDSGSGVASQAFEYRSSGGGSWTSTPAAWDTTALADGLYDVRVTATDAAGNATTSAAVTNRRVDNTAPAVTMNDPGADLSGTVTLSAGSSDGGSGIATVTYQFKLAADSTWTSTPAAWDTTAVGDGLYDVRAIATDNAGNATTSAPVTNRRVDNNAPSVSISAPGTHVNGSAADPYSVTATSPDSDLSQIEFFRCDNASASCSSGSWTSLGVDTSAPFSGSWPVDADGNRALRAVARDVAGNTGSAVANTLIDRTAPTGGSVTYADGYDADGTVTVSGSNGTDGGSGIDPASAAIERQTAPLADGACGAYGSWSTVASPDTVATGNCARYRLRVADNAGNVATFGSANAVTVDTTAPPAPSLTLTESEADEHVAGTTLYYNGQGSYAGTFTVAAAAGDAQSGIASVAFPLLFGDSLVDAGAPYSLAYDWTAPETTEGSFTVTATNAAGLSSGSAFTVVRDVTAPTGGSVSYVDGYRTSASVALTLADGADAVSGVDAASGLLRRASAPLADGVCGSFGGFATIAGDPAAGYTDLTVASGNCYRYEYVVADNVGNEVVYGSAAVVKIDAEAPTGSLNDPGVNLRGTVALTATAADTGGAGVASVEFRRSPAGGGPWTTIGTDSSAPYSVAFDTTAVADGLYDLQVVVSDGAGAATASALVSGRRVDNTAPTVSLADPGSHVRATVTLSASASDAGSGLAGTILQVAPAGSGSWTTTPAAWDTTALADGFYDLRAVATDNAGNQAVSTVLGRKVDNTPPGTTIDSKPGSLDNDATPTFAFSSNESPDATFECRVDGGSWSACPSPHTLASLADGSHTFDVRAHDLAGNLDASADSWTWTVDSTNPTVSLTYPTTGALLSGVVTLTASATDASGAPTVVFQVSPTGAGSWSTVTSSWDTASVADGRYDVRAVATDAAGNTSSATATDVLVDNTAPTVTMTSPAGAYVNAAAADPFGLAATASDAGSGVSSVEFLQRVDTVNPCASPSSSWSSIGLDATDPFGASWTLPADGPYVLCALARDAAGHTRSATASVTVDRTAPVPAIDAVAPYVRGTISLGSPSTDATSGVGQVDFQQTTSGGSSWQLVGADTAAPFAASFDTTTVADGLYDLRAFVTDRAGNSLASAPATTRVDNTAPTGSVTAPAAGSNLRLSVPVSSNSADGGSGVESAQFQTSPVGAGTWTNVGAADTSAPYGVTWDTTSYTDGLYDLRVITTDRAGNTFTSAVLSSARVDNTKPSAAITDPGAYLRGSVSLAGTAADEGSGVETVEFQRSPAGAGTWTPVATDTDAPYGASLDTTALADGLYDLRVLVTDRAGNQETGQIANRRVDNTKPTASLADPGAALNAGVTLSAAASDSGSGVASVAFERAPAGSGSWATLGTDTSDPYTAAFDTTAVPDGLYDLRAVVTDNAGNQETSVVGGRRVDNTAPTTTASGVPSGPTPGPVTITLAASDAGVGVAETKYRIDGGALQTYSGGITIPAVDGAYTIQYFSVDALGNVEATHSVEIVIDNTGPGAGPGDPGRYLHGVVTLTAAPTDASGIASVEFEFSPAGAGAWASIGTVLGAGPYQTTWNTVPVADGPYDIRVRVTDTAGNVTTELLPDLPKIVDNTSPTGSVTSPAEGALRSGTFTITATAADSPADGSVAAVEFQVKPSGGSWATVATDTSSPYAATWNSAGSPDGPAELRVLVSDSAGNTPTASAVRTITLDNNAPTVSLSAPSAGGGTIALTATGSADSAQVTFERRSGGGAWSAISTDSTPGDGFSASFATTSLPDGIYELRARAADVSGNEGTSNPQTISIDNTDPTANVAAPANGAHVGGPSVTLTATVSDATSGVATATFQLRPAGGGTWTDAATASSAPWSATWNATSLADGQYELRVRVVDAAGNTGYCTPISITVDSTAPTVTLSPVASTVSGSITLNAMVGGTASSVSFERRSSGGSWTAIGSDSSEPWSFVFDTSSVADGVYDLRAVARDQVGNSNESVQTGVRLDNSAPRLVSSVPSDGATVAAAEKVELTASEQLAGVDATVDGKAVPVSVSGDKATIAGTLGSGAHVVSGELRDAAGKSASFRISFTVGSDEGQAVEEGEVERNLEPGVGGTVISVDGGLTVIIPAGAIEGTEGWAIYKIDTGAPRGPVGGGFSANGPVWDITARTPSGKTFHSFAQPLELVFAEAADGVVPATFEDNRWRPLPLLARPGTLPAGQRDGFWRDGEKFHVLTRHLTLFAVLSDSEAPQPPQNIRGTVGAEGLTLHWRPGPDNSGLVEEVTLYVNGQRYASYAADVTDAKLGRFAADDPRVFTWRARDAAGNVSVETPRLRTLPPVAGKKLAAAQAALNARGFKVGAVTERPSSAPPGTVIAPAGIALAVEGTGVPLVVARGAAPAHAKLVFQVVGPKQLDRTKRSYVAVRIKSTRRVVARGTLVDASGRRLYTWRLDVRAGTSIVKLRLPRTVKRPGRYRIAFVARAADQTARRTLAVDFVRPGRPPTTRGRVGVVVIGRPADRGGVMRSLAAGRTRALPSGVDAAFDATGDATQNVGVVVVDVDRFGVKLVRDLRTVFPLVRIVALSDDLARLTASLKAGATVAMARSTPDAELVGTVRMLASRR